MIGERNGLCTVFTIDANFMSEITIVKNTSEIAAGTRGASLGVDAILLAALNKQYDFPQKHSIEVIEDENAELFKENTTKWAKNIKSVVKIYEKVANTVSNILQNDNFPLVIAGDHASSGGTIAGIKKAFPEKKLGIVWIDAHADLHSPYTTPSGNLHGMPLAVSLGEDNVACQQRIPDESTLEQWNLLKNIGNIQPKIQPDNIVFFAVRDTEAPEDFLREKYQIRSFSVEEIREKGAVVCTKEALERLEDCDLIYISYDVDSMDCDVVSKGTGTPVPNGLKPEECTQIISQLLESSKVFCLEVNPMLDNKCNLMAETAADALNDIIPRIKIIKETEYLV